MKTIRRILFMTTVLIVVMGCATAPDPEPVDEPDVAVVPAPAPPEPTPEPVPEPAVPAPEEERAAARELRQIITNYGMAEFAPDRYETGEESFGRAENAYGTDNEVAKEAYEIAIEEFNAVVDAGIAALRQETTATVAAARRTADTERAERVVSDLYRRAVATENAARQAESAENYREAFRLYGIAEQQFKTAHTAAVERRRAAEAELADIQRDVDESRERIEKLEQEADEADGQ